MSALEIALVALVKQSPVIGGLIGSRFSPDVIPIGSTYPATAYQRVSTQRQSRPLHPQRSEGGSLRSLAFARIQLTHQAKTAADRSAVAEAFRTWLVGYAGTLNGVKIAYISDPEERDMYTGSTSLYERQQDYMVQYTEE